MLNVQGEYVACMHVTSELEINLGNDTAIAGLSKGSHVGMVIISALLF